MSHYDVLEISSDATEKEIKTAFRRLAKIYHPDVSKGDTADHFVKIVEAFEALMKKDDEGFSYKDFYEREIHLKWEISEERIEELVQNDPNIDPNKFRKLY